MVLVLRPDVITVIGVSTNHVGKHCGHRRPNGIADRRSRHARAHVFYCVFCLVTGGLLLSVWWFLGVCDTPVVGLFFKGFGGVGLVGFALVAGLV